MSKFEFPKSIKSRPVYGALEARQGPSHLMIADAEGAEAIIELGKAGPELMATAHIIFVENGAKDRYQSPLVALKPAQLYIAPTYQSASQRIHHVLSHLHMGAQVYLAGTEGLIGQAMKAATGVGIPHTSIQTEHRGSIARRVQCVHCKGITENVTSDPFVCSHCGLNLFVRDHYSRRIAAFQGVRVDAEDHGNVPEPAALYS